MTAAFIKQVNTYQDTTLSVKNGTKGGICDDFSKVFEMNASKNTKEPNVDTKTDEVKSEYKTADSKTVRENEKAKNSSKEDSTGEVKNEKSNMDDALDEASKKAEEILNEIQKLLNVPMEQIIGAIENLSLQQVDLLDASNIQKLVLELTEGADEFTLMTDEALFTNLKELMALSEKQLSGLSGEFGFSIEELKDLLNMNQAEATGMDEFQTNLENNLKATQDTDSLLEQMTDKFNQNDAAVEKTEGKSSNQETKNENGNKQEFTYSQTIMQELRDAVSKIQDVKPMSYVSETDSIMDQISEMLKVTMKEDVTEMELQLHPASLGSVRVSVASKDGVITASFTTQNETVKAALESQIVTLKENLTQQGVKVEAVEVTVASHAFERNLNEEGEHSSGQMQEQKKTVRKINLNDLSDEADEEVLEQQDRIVADMMRKNGNTVDYTA